MNTDKDKEIQELKDKINILKDGLIDITLLDCSRLGFAISIASQTLKKVGE